MAAAGTQALFEQLTILLILATASHFLFRRFHQPTIIGEIGVGIVLGPSLVGNAALGPYRVVFDPAVVATLAVLGSIFLLFLIGLDFDFRAVYTPRNIAVAFGGVVLPLVVGFGTALYLAPATSIGVNGTPFTMALFVVATSAGRVSALDLAILLAEAVGFLAIGMAAGVYVFRRIVLRIQVEGKRLGLPHSGFLVAMAITFLFTLTAESIGLSAVVGAFLAGSVFAGTAFQKDFSEGARHLAAVFTPIFFVSLGLQVNVPAVAAQTGLIPLAAALTVIAVITKVVGCSLPARLARMTAHEAVAIGWGMTPRGEVGLIVAVTALTAGVIGDALFSVIVFVLILVTILPTPLFKRALRAEDQERRPAGESSSNVTETRPRGG